MGTGHVYRSKAKSSRSPHSPRPLRSSRQQNLFHSLGIHQFCHGGSLRNLRKGRKHRPLSCKEPLHVVFKVERERLRFKSLRSAKTYGLLHDLIRKYSRKFLVKIDQLSIQGDHIHILIFAPRRSQFHFFFRVLSGQIAQIFEREGMLWGSKPIGSEVLAPGKAVPPGSAARVGATNVTDTPRRGTGLWKYRPFSRVVRGWRAYKIARDYIRLNEQEARGKIPYRRERLRGLSSGEWEILWS